MCIRIDCMYLSMYMVVVFILRMISFIVFVCDDTYYASLVRLGCAVLGYNISIVAQVVDFSSLLFFSCMILF